MAGEVVALNPRHHATEDRQGGVTNERDCNKVNEDHEKDAVLENTSVATNSFLFITSDYSKNHLNHLDVTGALNAKNSAKGKIISGKMVQRQIGIKQMESMSECLDAHEYDDLSTDVQSLCKLPKTTVKVEGKNLEESFTWIHGDQPVIYGGDVKVNDRALETSTHE